MSLVLVNGTANPGYLAEQLGGLATWSCADPPTMAFIENSS